MSWVARIVAPDSLSHVACVWRSTCQEIGRSPSFTQIGRRTRLHADKTQPRAARGGRVSAGAKIPIVPVEFSPPLDVVNRNRLRTEEVPNLLRGRDVEELKELQRQGMSIQAISELTGGTARPFASMCGRRGWWCRSMAHAPRSFPHQPQKQNHLPGSLLAQTLQSRQGDKM